MTEPPQTPRSARAQAKAERAYRKASRPWILRHWLLTGAAVVIVIIIIAVAASSGGSSGGSGATSGKVFQHTEDVKVSKCQQDRLGDFDAKVVVTNHSSKPSDYDITIAFESPDGSKQYDSGDAFIDTLQPGQSTTHDVPSLTSAHHRAYKCVVSDAQRNEAF